MRKLIIAAVVAVTAVSSAEILAQYPPGGPGGFPSGGGAHGGMRGGQVTDGPGKARGRPSAGAEIGAPVQVQLDQLEDDLKLTPQQRGAWNAYADRVLSFADDLTREQFAARTSAEVAETAAVQQLDQLTNRARNRLTAIEDIAVAGKALYATLSPEQQTLADRRLVLPVLPLAVGLSPPGIAGPRYPGAR